MKKISELLGKFSRFGLDEGLLKGSLGEIIMLRTGFGSDLYTLVYKNNNIYIKGSPALRERIFMKKELILEDLQKLNLPLKPVGFK